VNRGGLKGMGVSEALPVLDVTQICRPFFFPFSFLFLSFFFFFKM